VSGRVRVVDGGGVGGVRVDTDGDGALRDERDSVRRGYDEGDSIPPKKLNAEGTCGTRCLLGDDHPERLGSEIIRRDRERDTFPPASIIVNEFVPLPPWV